MSWEESKLGDVITLKRGYDLPNRLRIKGSVPIISSAGISGNHSEHKYDGEGVITGRYGTLGEVFYINGKYWPLNTTLYVKDFKNNHPKFIYYLLKELNLSQYNGASAVPGLDRNVLHSIRCSVPSFQIQKRIASILSSYDNLIENNLRRINLLEQAAQNIYKEWFVNMRFPGYEEITIDQASGLPWGWRVDSINTIVEFKGGFAFKSKTYQKTGKWKVITIKNVGDRVFNTTAVNLVSELPDKLKEHCKIKEGEILLSLTGNVGRSCIAFGENNLLNQRVAKVVPKKASWLPFVYWMLNSKDIIGLMNNLATGTAQLNLSPIMFGKQEIVLPSEKLIESFSTLLESSYSQIVLLNKENLKLQKARDILLPRLMNQTIKL